MRSCHREWHRNDVGAGCTAVLEDPYILWHSSADARRGLSVRGRGYAFLGDDLYEGQDLVDEVRRRCERSTSLDSLEAFKKLVPTLNGCWALVAQCSTGKLVAATDRLRSIPLFYGATPRGLVLASSVCPLLDQMPEVSIDQVSALEFLLAGCVTGAHTLYEGVKQMQPGEMLEYDPGPASTVPVTKRYYRFLAESYSSATDAELQRECELVLDRVFARHTRTLAGRQVLVPLSGGLDSRLVAAMLKRHEVRDVLCYSYGPAGCTDSAASRDVATALGYNWRFIEYNGELWARWMASQEMADYWSYHQRFSTVPHLQDVPAVHAIVQAERLEDAVFIPGHSGDFLFGSHAPSAVRHLRLPRDRQAFLDAMLKWRFDWWDGASERLEPSERHMLLERIEAQTVAASDLNNRSAVARSELWIYENDQPKVTLGSLRPYEFLGRQWALPLWDHELMDFALALPERLRKNERLYLRTMVSRLYTGTLKALAHIPTNRLGSPRQRATGRGARSFLWNTTGAILDVLGTRQAARRFIRRHAIFRHQLGFESWFAEGRNPTDVTCGEVLARADAQRLLPTSLWRVLQPHLGRSLCQVRCEALVAAMAAARATLYSGNGHWKDHA